MRDVLSALLLLLSPSIFAESVSADQQLERFFESEWQRGIEENPLRASMLGDRRFNDQLPDISIEAIEQRQQADREALAALRAIDVSALSEANQLNYALFERDLAMSVAGQRFRSFLMPLNQRGGIQSFQTTGESIRLMSTADFDDWLSRLEKLDTYIEQTTALMRLGIKEGRVPSRITMERVPGQIAQHLVDDVTQSPFYPTFTRFPDAVPEAERTRLQARARAVLAETVIPAYREFASFFSDEYLPACRESVGYWDMPDGEAWYAHVSRAFTTTQMSPQEIHDIGLAEVKRIREQMQAIIEEVGFEGDFAAFIEHLRTSPEFYYETREELLAAYLALSKRIDPELVRLFGRLPRTPYGVRPISDAIAPDTTTAYYMRPAMDGSRAGYYYVNLYRPDTRPKYEMEALTIHEAMPGHHLQIALALEMENVPAFRRTLSYTAFIEGWALYSERLGPELGMYTDPYSRFGQLTYEMWRAVRLVVDTGLHQFKWSRERAIEFFSENAAKTEHDIVNEIDRYIAWPGQALAYKIGELKILELRQHAEQTLGEDFDIRAFHDLILEQGALPLEILEQRVRAKVAEWDQARTS